jgi:hypothetical protein
MRLCLLAGICPLLPAACVEPAKPKVIIKTLVVENPVAQASEPRLPASQPPIKRIVRVYIDRCPPKEAVQTHCANFRHNKDECEAECKPTGKRFVIDN